MNIKKGDIVARISYKKDIMFFVDKIIERIAILKGVTVRITADAPLNDLVYINKQDLDNNIKNIDNRINKMTKKYIKDSFKRKQKFNEIKEEMVYTGKILHLDGDFNFV